MTVIRNGKPYSDCPMCNGTGIDDADFAGCCFNCSGMGVVADDDDSSEFDDDEDANG